MSRRLQYVLSKIINNETPLYLNKAPIMVKIWPKSSDLTNQPLYVFARYKYDAVFYYTILRLTKRMRNRALLQISS